MDSRDFEQIVGGRLRQLPPLRAPETLLPRVLAAVQAWVHRPWYARAWFSWPAPLQIASIAVVVVVAGVCAMLLPGAERLLLARFASSVAPAAAPVSAAVESANAAAQTVRVLWRALIEPLAPYVLVFIVTMCAACAAFAAAINRVVIADHAHR
jgi:hypothetical protein